MNIETKIRHVFKFNKFMGDNTIDKCKHCNVFRINDPHVGDGFNLSLANRKSYKYSTDCINWSKDNIECICKT